MQFFSTDHYGANDFATFYAAIPAMSRDKPKEVCSLLDIKPDTLTRYLSGKSNPPKAMVRLLFHECHYGRSATDAHSHQGHVLALRQGQCLQKEVDQLKATIAALELENDTLKLSGDHMRDIAANSSRWVA